MIRFVRVVELIAVVEVISGSSFYGFDSGTLLSGDFESLGHIIVKSLIKGHIRISVVDK